MEKKKKVLIHSNCSLMKTGFGRNMRILMEHLYKTGKYDLVEVATGGFTKNDKRLKKLPWKAIGVIPDNHAETESLVRGGNSQEIDANMRMLSYGFFTINQIIQEEKPDCYLGIEDPWAFQNIFDQPWFNEINSALWITVDSTPILPLVKMQANEVDNYWVWVSFAEKELKKLGINSETVYGCVHTEQFKKLSNVERESHRKRNKIEKDDIIVGYVFRNQTRKLAYKTLEAFSQYKKENPKTKIKLLMHTDWSEASGWPLSVQIRELGIDEKDVLATYVCSNCKTYFLEPFTKEYKNCSKCGARGDEKEKRGLKTVMPGFGVSEKELNEIYNCMDAYCHPSNSGGFEVPILEYMLSGRGPVATVPYSYGLDFDHESTFYLEYENVKEIGGSNFNKAIPKVKSIKDFFHYLENTDKKELTKKALNCAKWAKNKFSFKKTLKHIEDWIDSTPEKEKKEIELNEIVYNDSYPLQNIEDNEEWVVDLYQNVLLRDPDPKGLGDWLSQLSRGVSRQDIHAFFINQAAQNNIASGKKVSDKKENYADLIEKTGNRKLVYVINGHADCYNALTILEEIRKVYEGWDIYVCTEKQFKIFFEHLTYLKGFLPYIGPECEKFIFWEGAANSPYKSIVDIAFIPQNVTMKDPSYTHNGLDINTLQE